jgi:putative ABC transport system permease protein
MSSLLYEIRYALRSLRQAPQITLACAVCIGIGIGANAITFELTNAVLLTQPGGVRSPERVVRLHFREGGPGASLLPSAAASYLDYEALRGAQRVFAGVAAYYADRVSLGAGPGAREATAAFASHTYLCHHAGRHTAFWTAVHRRR